MAGPDTPAQAPKRKVPAPKRKCAQSTDAVEPNLAGLSSRVTKRAKHNADGQQAATPPVSATVPPRFRRRPGAPTLIVLDDEASLSERESPLDATPRGIQVADRESNINDDGEELRDQVVSAESDNPEEDGEEPEPRDCGSYDDLAAEEVTFMPATPNQITPPVPNTPSLNLAQESAPEVLDNSDDDPTFTDIARNRKSTHRMRKLAEELPVITTPSRAMSSAPVITSDMKTTPSPTADGIPWLDRTDISSALKQASVNTWTFHIRSCESAEMQRVLHASFERGIKYLALGGVRLKTPNEAENLVTPFGLHGMEQISLGALITSADALGYNAEYDIVQRLQTGSEHKYIAPLRTYQGVMYLGPYLHSSC
ncbi:hypothetical protein C8Q77DRAFT_1074365 [Trametes polyzona]|nr:hypothetical protein C8Q77DRAFT_1074365 [Trametes polyzona]